MTTMDSGAGSGKRTPATSTCLAPRTISSSKGQSAEHDIDWDSAWLVQDKQNAAFLGEVESIVDTWDEPENLSGRQEFGPFPAFENHEDVDVFGESRPPQNRGGDATDDHPGGSSRIKPLRHRAERLDERRRRVVPPPGRSMAWQA